uniref:Uncharacterized protein n=1 Tax=Anguilla anguilla TaxID=7936 RepID=A0A0E9XA06_ANGAN
MKFELRPLALLPNLHTLCQVSAKCSLQLKPHVSQHQINFRFCKWPNYSSQQNKQLNHENHLPLVKTLLTAFHTNIIF